MTTPSLENRKPPAPAPGLPSLWNSFRSEIDSLFHRFDGGFGFPAVRRLIDVEPLWSHFGTGALLPAIDIVENDKAYSISAELPGLDEKNVTVTLSGDRLVIKGEKSQEKEEKDESRSVSERSYGAFERSFRLPENVDRDRISASVSKGVLHLDLPKNHAAAPTTKIDVKAAKDENDKVGKDQ